MTITKTLHIEVIGKIWMPMVDAVTSFTIDEKEFERCGIDPFSQDSIERYLATHTGDFSSVDGYNAIVVERKWLPSRIDEDGWNIVSYGIKETVIRQFTDDEQVRYDECSSGIMDLSEY